MCKVAVNVISKILKKIINKNCKILCLILLYLQMNFDS